MIYVCKKNNTLDIIFEVGINKNWIKKSMQKERSVFVRLSGKHCVSIDNISINFNF